MKQALIRVLMALLAVFAPIQDALLVVMLLTILDLITGLIAARKRGEKITSSGLKRTIIKTCVYETTVMLAFLTETHLVGDLIPLVKICTAYIGITELKSVLENLDSISGMSLLKTLVKKLSPKD